MLKHRNAPGSELEQAGYEVVTPVHKRHGSYSYVDSYKVESDNLQQLVTAAVARALENTDGRNIVVVNLNIQIAHGSGGVANQIGTQPSANNHWSDRP